NRSCDDLKGANCEPKAAASALFGNKPPAFGFTMTEDGVMASAGGLHQLIDAHYQALYRYAYRLSGCAADAEDLTQETFGKALARLAQLREPDRAKAWLFRILRNGY